MKTLKESLIEYIDGYTRTKEKMPSDDEIQDFKMRYRKYYLKEYKKNTKTDRSQILLTFKKSELKNLDKFCQHYKKKRATLIKEIVLTYLNNENLLTDEAAENLQGVIIQLRKIGTNINQLTKLANQKGFHSYQSSFNGALTYLQGIEEKIINLLTKKP